MNQQLFSTTNLNRFGRFGKQVILAFTFLFALQHSVQAANIYVNSTTGNDGSGDGTAPNPYQSFHKAYTMAVSGDVILLQGTFTWTDALETGDAAQTGYTLSKNLTIRGEGRNATYIQAAATYNTADRSVFFVAANTTVTFEDLTIRYGKVSQEKLGGGLTLAGQYCGNYPCSSITGTAILNRVDVVQNVASVASNVYYLAGGIYLREASTITKNYVNVNDNSCTCKLYSAGAIAGGEQSQSITINNSTISSNSATSTFGSTYAYSYASVAGAMALQRFGRLKITNSTIANNTTDNYGGALVINYNYYPTLTNVTLVNNSATLGASGILFETPTSGAFYTLYIKNSLLANNTNGTTPSDLYAYNTSSGNNIVASYDIIEYATNTTLSGTGMITGDQSSLHLGSTLEDNRSTMGTKTFSIGNSSIAKNAGNSSAHGNSGYQVTPTSGDQRDKARVGNPDIGAYEFDAFIWSGATNTDWNTVSNWINNAVPPNDAMVVIPQGCNRYPLLTQDEQVNELHLDSGYVNTSTHQMIVGNSTTLYGALTSTRHGYVKGIIKRYVPSQTATLLFPLGDEQFYYPATVDFTSAPSSGGTLTASHDPNVMNWQTFVPVNDGGTNITDINDGLWEINAGDGLSGGTYSIHLNTNKIYGVTNKGILRVLKRSVNSDPWGVQGAHVTGTGSNTSPIVSRSGLSGFSEFTIGTPDGNELPVELSSFTAECEESYSVIRWTTQSEHNSSHFIIEKSTDGTHWQYLDQVMAAGNSTNVLHYEVEDRSAFGLSYYRLVQTDKDGAYEIFGPVSSDCESTQIVVTPNPNKGNFVVRFGDTHVDPNEMIITNNFGKTVWRFDGQTTSGGTIEIKNELTPGVYYLTVGNQTEKIVVM